MPSSYEVPQPPSGDPAGLRRSLGLTQEQVSEAAQCSLAAVRRFEDRFRPAGVSPVEQRILAVLREKE